jgi:proline dehydrogenase
MTVIAAVKAWGAGGILNLLGEGVIDPEGAQVAAEDYLAAVKRIDETRLDATVSVKLTQLGLAFDRKQCIEHVRRIASEAAAVGTTVEIDMEESEYVTGTIDVYRQLHADFPDLRLAMQAYLRRTPHDLQEMAELEPRIRLVKGAYAEPASVAFQKRKEVAAQYAFLTDWLFDNGTDPAIATHDHRLIRHAIQTARHVGAEKHDYEIQLIYGIRRDLQLRLATEGYRVRSYVPYGSAWYPYLMRRIAERPANVRFFLRAMVRG